MVRSGCAENSFSGVPQATLDGASEAQLTLLGLPTEDALVDLHDDVRVRLGRFLAGGSRGRGRSRAE